MKDIVIVVAIIIVIIIGNIITQNILKNDSEEMISMLNFLNENIYNEDMVNKKVDELKEKWDEMNKRWSIFVTHTELDAIELSILQVKTGIEIGDISTAYEEIENASFLLKHIKEKNKISIENVF